MMDNVDAYMLLDNVRFLVGKFPSIDIELKERILNCLNTYESIIEGDYKLACELGQNLIIIRQLILKESVKLERKFNIFEKKIDKVAKKLFPIENRTIEGYYENIYRMQYQDRDICLIDTTSKTNAERALSDAKILYNLVKEILNLAEVSDLPKKLKAILKGRAHDVLQLLKVDAKLAIKLGKDLNEVLLFLNGGRAFDEQLEYKLKILRLKLKILQDSYDVKEINDHKRIAINFQDQLEKAREMLHESTVGGNYTLLKDSPISFTKVFLPVDYQNLPSGVTANRKGYEWVVTGISDGAKSPPEPSSTRISNVGQVFRPTLDALVKEDSDVMHEMKNIRGTFDAESSGFKPGNN